ncbi:polysaccharide deacetylase family protein [Neobacillus vireti]|uniref:Polysaccharide deacetylase-like protein n=1 Tax=Neobacillus vireti LMG 21834 TaxID=1131730 RepID=A0AB94IJ55_9BACI|nr:polysaccharide deacetylase family protein [Neobacillus vireti]ETI67068.1 polysaccharide deacetylase-like protein [Neobacillus vireti LMG 21834]KLT20011.1 polysaccharide deacetylase [Neobacillus vireti]
MQKLQYFALIFTLLLSGCSLKEVNASTHKVDMPAANSKVTMKMSKVSPQIKKIPVFEPQATIAISPIAFDSTHAVLSTVGRKNDVSKINYHIWCTADGKKGIKMFTATQKENDFPFLFDIKEFSGSRGEYQIEAYEVTEDGSQILLAKSTLTFQQRVPILMYHAIDEYKGVGLKDLFVTPANFEAQMSYLKDKDYTLLTFERWDEVNKVNKPILVTFDDGMKNNLNAFRILQELKDDQFQPTATEYVIAGSIDSSPSRLSTEDIKEMVNSGIFSIQSHTMSHADLPEITNYEQELNAAKEKIEQITGKPVIAIAYPFGHFNDQVVEETKKYYKFATTTKPGQFIEKGETDEFMRMRRVRISNSTTINQFAAMVEPR